MDCGVFCSPEYGSGKFVKLVTYMHAPSKQADSCQVKGEHGNRVKDIKISSSEIIQPIQEVCAQEKDIETI